MLCATGITGCILDGTSLNLNQCYNANTFFTTPLALDWGTAFGKADTPDTLGSSITTNIGGVNVGLSVGPDFSPNSVGAAPALRRVNNEVFVWDPNHIGGGAWVVPEFSVDPNIHASNTYDGHFNAPGPTEQTGDGEHLIGMNGTGSYVLTFSQSIRAAGLLLSVQGAGFNSDFDATIQAFNQAGSLVSTYVIDTTGVGGQCTSINNNPPTPCNDSPFIGVRAPSNLSSQQISRIVISATTGIGNTDSLLLDSLMFDESAPEPSVVFLCGGGLVLIGVLRRKQAARASRP